MAVKVASTEVITDGLRLDNITGASGSYDDFHPSTRVVSVSGTRGINFADTTGIYEQATMTANTTFNVINQLAGRLYHLLLTTGGFTPTFAGATFRWPGGSQPTWSDQDHWHITFQALSSSIIYVTATGYGQASTTPQSWPTGTYIARGASTGFNAAEADTIVQDVAPVSASATLIISAERTSSGSEINVRHLAGTGVWYNTSNTSQSMPFNTNFIMWQETTVVPDSFRIITKNTGGTTIADTGYVSVSTTGDTVEKATTATAYVSQASSNDIQTLTHIHYVYGRKSGYVDTELASFRFFCEAEADSVACFSGTTEVLLWNSNTSTHEARSAINLYDEFMLRSEGDVFEVIGQDGSINQIIDMHRHEVNTPMYELNESEAFITGGHPFLTTDGWKCMDPNVGIPKYPDLNLGQIRVGDQLVKYNTETQTYYNEEVTSIVPVQREAIVYSIDVDGNDTYIINNYVVHNK